MQNICPGSMTSDPGDKWQARCDFACVRSVLIDSGRGPVVRGGNALSAEDQGQVTYREPGHCDNEIRAKDETRS